MKHQPSLRKWIVVPLLFLVSGAAMASSQGSVSYAPGVAAQVPTMTDGLLITLGLLLMVIAARTFAANRNYQKIASIALLGGGLAVGGLGVERTLATQAPVTPSGSECSNGGSTVIQEVFRSDTQFTNGCPNVMTITGYDLPCTEGDLIDRAPVGTSVNPDETISLSYCSD